MRLAACSWLRKKQLERFKAWRRSSSQIAYFFLDSFDELQLVHGSFREALERVADEIAGAFGRAVIVVTSRPIPIDRQAFVEILPVPTRSDERRDGEAFVQTVMRLNDGSASPDVQEKFKEYYLEPLNEEQIAAFARFPEGREARGPD